MTPSKLPGIPRWFHGPIPVRWWFLSGGRRWRLCERLDWETSQEMHMARSLYPHRLSAGPPTGPPREG